MYKGQYDTPKQAVWTEEHLEKFLPLVKRIAGRLAMSLPEHIDQEDLFGYGVFGLLDALQKFDPSRGVKFETYATLRIRGSIIDGLRTMDWVPHSARQKVKQVTQGYAWLENQLGRSPTLEEAARHLDISVEELNATLLQGQYMTLVSLEDVNSNDNEDITSSPLDLIIDPSSQDSFGQIEKEEQKQILTEAIEKLSEKEKLVVALYYREELTLKEISVVMNLSESRISQVHSQAILRLRGYLGRQKKNIF
ncbi:MAG: FliA/WhiG family RNA polymerase sigma factor [Dehalobacter sp. 4CP]|uniref:FliA/WhiG family RNA polymerase sigma factor n=1 Tax=Dehalobacter sp. CP TaxID=2594474 RepID=UPI0013CC5AF9|nr:FliA/WhiG family RNA polymerase sigma factor [Dehalobacter sp. 4CP]